MATAIADEQHVTVPANLNARLEARFNGEMIEIPIDSPEGVLRGVITEIATPLVDAAAYTLEGGHRGVWEPFDDDAAPQALWRDLRPSEALLLRDLTKAALDRALMRCEAAIVEELLGAAEAFVLVPGPSDPVPGA